MGTPAGSNTQLSIAVWRLCGTDRLAAAASTSCWLRSHACGCACQHPVPSPCRIMIAKPARAWAVRAEQAGRQHHSCCQPARAHALVCSKEGTRPAGSALSRTANTAADSASTLGCHRCASLAAAVPSCTVAAVWCRSCSTMSFQMVVLTRQRATNQATHRHGHMPSHSCPHMSHWAWRAKNGQLTGAATCRSITTQH
jgi:hypothetical protein